MNYGEIINSFCRTNTVDEQPPNFSATDEETRKKKQMINNALSEIFCEEWNFRKSLMTFSTVAEQSSYDKPEGIICRNGVSVGGNVYTHSLTDTYNSYKIVGSKIILYPVPTEVQTVEITYLNLMSGLSAEGVPQIGLTLETDTPNIPVTFHDLIVSKAELFYIRDKQRKNSVQARADVQKRINQLIDLDRGTLEASPIIIL